MLLAGVHFISCRFISLPPLLGMLLVAPAQSCSLHVNSSHFISFPVRPNVTSATCTLFTCLISDRMGTVVTSHVHTVSRGCRPHREGLPNSDVHLLSFGYVTMQDHEYYHNEYYIYEHIVVCPVRCARKDAQSAPWGECWSTHACEVTHPDTPPEVTCTSVHTT